MANEEKAANGERVKKNAPNTDLIEATFKHLARINGEINKMDTNQLIERLKYYNLDTNGNDDIRRRRLKNMYRRIKLESIDINISRKLLSYYVIIDFEATCLEVNPPEFEHEIIEFPAVLVSSETQEVVDTFQMYCKPVINPKLSDFCVELTGITQERVDNAQTFNHVLEHFQNWLRKHNLDSRKKFSVVTDTPLDMSKFLFQQCQHSNIPYPQWAERWVNLRRSFSSFYKCNRMPLKGMLNYFEMEFEGRLHCGLDDAKNIARILIRMIRDGANIQANEKISNKCKYVKQQQNISNNESKSNGDCETDDVNKVTEGIKKLRVSAEFAVIENKEQLSTYERVKRERGKLRAKINREFKDRYNVLDLDENVLQWVPPQEIKPREKHKIKWKKLDMNS